MTFFLRKRSSSIACLRFPFMNRGRLWRSWNFFFRHWTWPYPPQLGLSISSIFFLRKKNPFLLLSLPTSLLSLRIFLAATFWSTSYFGFSFSFLFLFIIWMAKPKMPGFRFQPTDVELIEYFLKRKVRGKKFPSEIIAELVLWLFQYWRYG